MQRPSCPQSSGVTGSRRARVAARVGAAVAIGCFGLVGVAGTGSVAAQQSPYPIDTTTTTTTTIPGQPTTTQGEGSPPLPRTGSSGIGDSLMVGATIALAGFGLVLVSRRRRHEPGAA